MVLQEAVSGDPDRLSSTSHDNPPPSDNDSYTPSAFNDTQAVQYQLDTAKLVKPVPLFGPLLGYSLRATQWRTKAIAANSYKLLRRPLTQDEFQAIAEHQAMAMRITSVGGTIGLYAGVYRAWKTKDQFKFPFLKPMEPGAIDMSKFGPLRGEAAKFARHALRVSSYAAIGVFVGDIFFQGYATANLARSIVGDERLHEFADAMKATAVRGGSGQSGTGALPEQGKGQIGLDEQRGGSFSRTSNFDDDDMSPKAAFASDMLSDEDMRRREKEQARVRQQESRENNVQQERSTQTYNDAFGTPSNDSRKPAQSSGSAWDRLRQGASSGQDQSAGTRGSWPPRDQNRERQAGATLGDSFAFSSDDEERQLAKSEAQKEFDARIERERKGGDFNQKGNRW